MLSNSGEMIKSYIQRVERIEQEIDERQNDRKEIYAEAKSNGFDVFAIKSIIKQRKEDVSKRAEREAIIDTYIMALGDFIDTPLGIASKPV